MKVHPEKFRRHMAWLKRLGYHGLSLREAIPYIDGKKAGKVAAITFDDGFANVLENAAPTLEEFGFTATNFIVTNQIGGGNEWDLHKGIPPAACMTAEQLKEWMSLGHEIGAHTLDHVHLTQQSDDEAYRQIEQSRVALEAVLGTAVGGFAYPYGDQAPRHREMVKQAGFAYAVTTVKRSAHEGDGPFDLPRLTIRRNDTWLQFLVKCLAR